MKNARELRNELISVFEGVKKGTAEVRTAETLNKTATKIMQTVSQQLRYAKDRKVKPQIGFLNCK